MHCKAGKSRSVTAVMAYLIHAYRWSLSRAYAFVAERRDVVSPNIGFVAELMTFEQRERTLTMVASGAVHDENHSNSKSEKNQEEKAESERSERLQRTRDSLPSVGMASTKSADFKQRSSPALLATSNPAVPDSNPQASATQPNLSDTLSSTQANPSTSPSTDMQRPQLPGISHHAEVENTEAELEIEIRGSDNRYRSRVPPFKPNLVSARRATLSGIDSSNSFKPIKSLSDRNGENIGTNPV